MTVYDDHHHTKLRGHCLEHCPERCPFFHDTMTAYDDYHHITIL